MGDKGKFIVFEGIDGSGKSTQSRSIYQRLFDENIDAVLTFEPSDGPVGRLIRKMLEGEVTTDQHTIANLFAADRTDHLVNRQGGVKNWVDQGRAVVCDRYYFSSYAYHSLYMDMDWVIKINEQNARILRPDLTIFIDVDPKICLERIRATRKSFDMYEKIEILNRVRQNYFTAFNRLEASESVAVIEGNHSREQVEQDIWNRIQRLWDDSKP